MDHDLRGKYIALTCILFNPVFRSKGWSITFLMNQGFRILLKKIWVWLPKSNIEKIPASLLSGNCSSLEFLYKSLNLKGPTSNSYTYYASVIRSNSRCQQAEKVGYRRKLTYFRRLNNMSKIIESIEYFQRDIVRVMPVWFLRVWNRKMTPTGVFDQTQEKRIFSI